MKITFKKLIRLIENTDDIEFNVDDDSNNIDLNIFDRLEKDLIEQGKMSKDDITVENIQRWIDVYGLDWVINSFIGSDLNNSLHLYKVAYDEQIVNFIMSKIEKFSDTYFKVLSSWAFPWKILSIQDFITIHKLKGDEWLNNKLYRCFMTLDDDKKQYLINYISSNPVQLLPIYSPRFKINQIIFEFSNKLKEIINSMSLEEQKYVFSNSNIPLKYFPNNFAQQILGIDNTLKPSIVKILKQKYGKHTLLNEYGKPTNIQCGKKTIFCDAIKLPFKYAPYVLSKDTTQNIIRLSAAGIKFKYIYITNLSGENRLSTFITGRSTLGPLTFARVETHNKAAGQTKVYYNNKVFRYSQINDFSKFLSTGDIN